MRVPSPHVRCSSWLKQEVSRYPVSLITWRDQPWSWHPCRENRGPPHRDPARHRCWHDNPRTAWHFSFVVGDYAHYLLVHCLHAIYLQMGSWVRASINLDNSADKPNDLLNELFGSFFFTTGRPMPVYHTFCIEYFGWPINCWVLIFNLGQM